jgi:hypothetical protein
MIKILKHVRFTVCAFALLAPAVFAQNDSAEQASQAAQQPPATAPAATPPPVTPTVSQDNTPSSDATVATPRYNFGFRIEYFPERFFQTQYVVVNTTNPILSTGNFGTSAGSKLAFGLTSEFRLNDRLSVGVDFFRHQEEYTQLSQIKSGLQDPNSSYDNRPLTSINLDTRADYWDFPLVARYYAPHFKNMPHGMGWLSQTFVLGGGTYRHVSNIRTGTSTTEPDGSTSYNEIPAAPLHNNLLGVTGGVGYKLFEYGKFKAMAEARYTRWFADTFAGPAYQSQKNQLEIGLSFTY